jgi:hypothetical protein
MDPTHYKTASGKDVTIKVKPTGIHFGCFSRIRIGGRTVWDSETYPEGCAQQAKDAAVSKLEDF